MVQLVKNPELRARMGQQARETVRQRFLLTRYLEQYLDLFGAFESTFRLRYHPGTSL
jgi:trehalose synthase